MREGGRVVREGGRVVREGGREGSEVREGGREEEREGEGWKGGRNYTRVITLIQLSFFAVISPMWVESC